MKIAEKFKRRKLIPSNRRGVALLTVLTVMSLMTILVLTFFSLATNEHAASNTYSNGLQAHQVAEQAVNMVIAQIREATVKRTSVMKVAWASQPGAVRTWNSQGNLEFIYKLYSSATMKTNDDKAVGKDYAALKNWSSKPDHYVDLNEPVIRGEKVYYPIVHPAAEYLPKWPKALDGDDGGVEGFDFDPNALDQGEFGRKAAAVAGAKGHVAMPVEWIYQLADGTLGVLGASKTTGALGEGYKFLPISGSGSPSATNPMVSRFAFWADDETSKLNINVHAGGLAWDIPKAGGEMDMSMGKFQPAQKEWQRYPGHPATTHLSPALAPGVLDIVNDRDAMEMLYKVVPRIVGGGSESGTRVIDTRDPEEQNGLIPDKDPLFPSLDDMVMRPDRQPHQYPDAKGNPIPEKELSEYLERSRFFVTAVSRAPEVNMFNLPKVAIWPIFNAERDSSEQSDYQEKLTAFDRLIHYCATVGKNPDNPDDFYDYIFRREKADSATHDFDKIDRNKELYAYLFNLLSERVPGYDGSFADKYGDDFTRRILTSIFDYIRCTNLHDDTLFEEDFKKAFAVSNTSEHRTFTNPRDDGAKGFGLKGHGQVTPIVIGKGADTTKGFGRFFTIAGANTHVICAGKYGSGPGLYPGLDEAGVGEVDGPEGTAYYNLPPLPQNTTQQNPSSWPSWLTELQTTNPEEFQEAFNEAQWNWNLAFLDDTYKSNVLGDPTKYKFNRNFITKSMCENMRLAQGEYLLQAGFFFQMFSPSIGWGSINPDMEVHVYRETGMTYSSTSSPSTVEFLGFQGQDAMGDSDKYIWATNIARPQIQGGARSYGGLLPIGYILTARERLLETDGRQRQHVWRQLQDAGHIIRGTGRSRLTPIDKGYNHIQSALGSVGRDIGTNALGDIAQAYRYDLVTVPFKSGAQVEFNGGTVRFEVYDGGEHTEMSAPDDGVVELVQEVTMNIPAYSVPAPEMPQGFKGWINEFGKLSQDSRSTVEMASLTSDPGNPKGNQSTKASMRSGGGGGDDDDDDPPGGWGQGRMSVLANHWSRDDSFIRGDNGGRDVVQQVGVPHGDMRLVATKSSIDPGDGLFVKHHNYDNNNVQMAHSLTNAVGVALEGFDPNQDSEYLIVPGLENERSPTGKKHDAYRDRTPLPFVAEKSADVQFFGDFDNGAGTMIDGPYINKPDEGNVHSLKTKFTQEIVGYWESQRNYGDFPYFSRPDLGESGGPAYFSPNRIVSGPGMFGSLPTYLDPDDEKKKKERPWQTLLFRPQNAVESNEIHPGAGKNVLGASDPPDHVIMDLFWMPVVEPYAISEPISTAGKVNLNYQLAPFLHVKRDTALRGVFRSEFMLCVPVEWHGSYKHNRGRGAGYHWKFSPYGGELQGKRMRTAIVESDTLAQFEDRFNSGRDLFKSATEICEIHLVPQEVSERLGYGSKGSIGSYTPTVGQLEDGSYWKDHALVGDNSRERPYTNIHQRVTTKSNTFKVHYRAQVIKQARRSDENDYSMWIPDFDTVQAEYRGDSIVERFVDPNSTDIPDYVTLDVSSQSISDHYQFRVVSPRRFAP